MYIIKYDHIHAHFCLPTPLDLSYTSCPPSSIFKPPHLLKPLNSFSAAYVCMDVGPSTEAYQTYICTYSSNVSQEVFYYFTIENALLHLS